MEIVMSCENCDHEEHQKKKCWCGCEKGDIVRI